MLTSGRSGKGFLQRCGSWIAASQDLLVQLAALIVGFGAKLACKCILESLILAKRLHALTSQGVEAHQAAVRFFMGGVANWYLPESLDGRGVRCLRLIEPRKLDQQAKIYLAQYLAANANPLFIAVFGQEIPGIQVKRGAVCCEILAVACALCGGLEGFYIDPQRLGRAQVENLVLKLEIARPSSTGLLTKNSSWAW